jgi:hypothetical protein
MFTFGAVVCMVAAAGFAGFCGGWVFRTNCDPFGVRTVTFPGRRGGNQQGGGQRQ